ncbi:MAG: hypothetical protein KBT47_04190, partial [Armatimonadetes bacterium]|nr:hypothetical protein [Candidatus Hippobium faecium]
VYMRRTRVNQETPFGAVRMAVIDISLNSVKLLISTKQLNAKIDFDKDESTINLLSKTLRTKGVIDGEALDILLEITDQYLAVALKYCEPRFTKIISTEVLSESKNKKEIIRKIEEIWFERVEYALRERVKLWEKEMRKPKKLSEKSTSAKDPDKVRKDFEKFKNNVSEKYNLSLEEFLDDTALVKKYVREEHKPEIIVYSKTESTKLYYGLILNDIQKSQAKKYSPNSTIVDLTGDSLRIVQCKNGKIISDEDLSIGILSYTSKYVKDGNVEKKMIPQIKAPAKQFFEKNKKVEIPENLVFIGGSAINLARICREVPVTRSNDVHGYEIERADLHTLLEGMCALTYKKRNTLIGLQEGRQNTILSACVILLEFMESVGAEKAVLSTYGLRHKVIIDMLEKNFATEKAKRELEEYEAKVAEYNKVLNS